MGWYFGLRVFQVDLLILQLNDFTGDRMPGKYLTSQLLNFHPQLSALFHNDSQNTQLVLVGLVIYDLLLCCPGCFLLGLDLPPVFQLLPYLLIYLGGNARQPKLVMVQLCQQRSRVRSDCNLFGLVDCRKESCVTQIGTIFALEGGTEPVIHRLVRAEHSYIE